MIDLGVELSQARHSLKIAGLELDRTRFHEPERSKSAEALCSLLDSLDAETLVQLAIEADRPLPTASEDNKLGALIFSPALFSTIASRFRKLRLLSLRGSELLDNAAIATLHPSLGSVKSLDLGSGEITDAGLFAALSAAPNLDRLVLRRCQATQVLLPKVCQHGTLRSLHLFSIPGISIFSLLELSNSTSLKHVRIYAVEFIKDSQPQGWGDTRLMRQVKGTLFERRGIQLEYLSRKDVWTTVDLDV